MKAVTDFAVSIGCLDTQLNRKMLDNPIVCKDAEYFSVWCLLLLLATHKEIDKIFKGKKIKLKPRTINYWKKIYIKRI